MNVDTMPNGSDLAKTSPSAHRPKRADSEADYLAREIADAKLALIHTTEELKGSLRSSFDLAQWIKQYPWAALGVASVAGFAVATIVTPEPGQSIGDKWSQLAHDQSTHNRLDEAKSKSPDRPVRTSFASTLFGPLFDLAKLLVEGLILAAVRAPTPQDPAGNRP
jgi:hypothetical protein